MTDSPDEISITSLSIADGTGSTADEIGLGCGKGVPLMDSLQLEMIGEDGRDKVSSLAGCFALCLLERVT